MSDVTVESISEENANQELEAGYDRPMTIIEHLEELRTRLIHSVIAVAITTALSFAFLARPVLDILKAPAGVDLVATQVTEGFAIYMKVALYLGLALAMPILVYELIMFIAPALTRREKRAIFQALPAIILFFIFGIAFGYFVLVPPAVRFLITFGAEYATPMITISDYVGLVTRLLFWIGVAFETPIIIFALARLGIVTPQRLGSYRRYAVVVAFLLGAIITPTFDPVNQSLVAVPLILLYELGILLARIAR